MNMAGNVGSTATAMTDGSRVTIDLIAPALLTVSVSSDNAADSQRANGGDTVTVEITANEDIVAPSVLIADHPASVDGGGITWTAVYTVVADDVSDGEASLSITFEDVAGNSGPTRTASTDAPIVTIDLSAPILLAVSIVSSNNADATRANAGDTISLSILSSEAIVTPAITIAGQAAVVTGSGLVWYAAYTIIDAEVENGEASLAIVFEDLASNSGVTRESVTDSSVVTIDLVAPTLTEEEQRGRHGEGEWW